MQFPNLPDATDFPNDNVRVFAQYRNGFDYHRWSADTRILVCSVPWDASGNVVAFDDDDARDEWFASLDGYRDTLQTEMRILPDGMIKVPIPFDASGLYNYVWVTFPIATSADKPLDYEPKSAVRHWGFFIEDLRYRSPSCTELSLAVDWWTTFINGIDVRSMMLARGHYAMRQAALVEDFLAEPVAHTAWLQGIEPELVGEPTCRIKASVIVNDSDPYLVFDVASASPGGDFSVGVPYIAPHYLTGLGLPTGNFFAVALADADMFASSAPTGLWQCVRAAYVVPGKWLSLGTSYQVGSVTVHAVAGGATITQDVHLTAEDFGYIGSYADITKLYTSPYATVHLVSDTGQDVTIAPETLGSTQRVDMSSQITAAGVRVLSILQGVGSSVISNLRLQNLTARDFAQSGAWQRTIMQWDMPCFAVYQSADELADYQRQWARQQSRDSAYAAYQSALASNATAQANANASATTAQANANASASTSRTNANASASTAQTNAGNSAATGLTNAQATNQTAYDNTDANATLTTTTASNSASNITSNNAATVAANTANTNANIAQSTAGANASNIKLVQDVTSDLNSSYAALQADQAVVSVTMSNNDARSQAAQVAQDMSLVSGAASVVGAALSGNIGQVVSGTVSTITGQVAASSQVSTDWQTANASALVTASNNTALYNAGVTNATQKGAHAQTYTTNATSISNTAKSTINSNNNSAANTIAANNANLTNSNAASQAATMRANASRSQTTGNANAQRTRDTTVTNASNAYGTTTANATRSYDTTVANAQRSYDTAVANAQRSRDTGDANARRTYDNALAAVSNGILTDNAGAPHSFGAVSGMDARQIVPMGVQVKIERATDDDIARCGDSMLRYGYCCNRNVYRFPGWQVMKHYTYWQARETWMTADGKAPESAVRYIRSLIESGVTVWSKPEEIGAVSIYDN